MNQEAERDKLQKQCIRLAKYTALVRAEPLPAGWENTEPAREETACRRALQAAQSLTLSGFLSDMLENSFQLLQTPEQARAIGSRNINAIHVFLSEYIDLFRREYQWCAGAEDENSPPGR